MKIKLEFHNWDREGSYYYKNYGVIVTVLDDKGNAQPIFIDTEKYYELKTVWIDINKLNDEQFFKDNDIEYVIEVNNVTNEKNIIPVGLVDFKNRSYVCNTLAVFNYDGEELYKANQIIKNIIKAIEMKYETVKFINRFSDTKKEVLIEEINLGE